MRRLAATFVVVLVAVGVAAPPGAAAPAPATRLAQPTDPATDRVPPGGTGGDALMVVLDVSGSMADADPNGTVKLVGAKAALKDAVDALDPDVRLGLSTYPAAGADCTSEVVVPLQRIDKTEVKARIDAVEAAGNTPTAPALRRAGTDLEAAGAQEPVIVLVSDGQSNCGGDPCAVAEELVAKGIDVTVHTVGFQISSEGERELQCIADATRGSYLGADDSEALLGAIGELTSTSLDLELAHPGSVVLQPGTGRSSAVSIHATVTNTSEVRARDVQAAITYDARFAPFATKPRVRIGNLDPGESRTFAWTFTPSDEFSDHEVSFTATAVAHRAEPVSRSGTIRFVTDGADGVELPLLSRAQHIVQLGDSYSSGEGAGGYTDETDHRYNTCHRSPERTWGAHLAAGRTFTLLACTGAIYQDLYLPAGDDGNRTPDGEPWPSQIQQLRDLDTPPDLIVMTMGGNDVDFAMNVVFCIAFTDCRDETVFGLTTARSDKLVEDLRALPRKVRTGLVLTARAAEVEAGRPVPILVAAYPQPFPTDTRGCRRLTTTTFGSHRNMAFLNDVARSLNEVLRTEITRLRTERSVPVYFVSETSQAYLPDHTACHVDTWINRPDHQTVASGGAIVARWVASRKYPWLLLDVAPDPDVLRAYQAAAHPNEAGYRAIAAGVRSYLEAFEGPVPDRPDHGRYAVDHRGSLPGRVRVGSVHDVTGSGFAPRSPVLVRLASDPEPVGTATAGDDGTVVAQVTVAPDVEIGDHHVILSGIDPDGEPLALETAITVTRPTPDWWLPVTVASGLAAAAGAGCAVVAWRRPSAATRRRR